MPKEFITNRYYGQYATEVNTGEKVPLDGSRFVVCWTKDREDVELAILRTGEEHNPDDWYSQLDRAGINRLIRVLRKARDDSFGRDE